MGQSGFFDGEKRLAALSKKGDPLEAIAVLVPCDVAPNFYPATVGVCMIRSSNFRQARCLARGEIHLHAAAIRSSVTSRRML
jgi:hypothetical protein